MTLKTRIVLYLTFCSISIQIPRTFLWPLAVPKNLGVGVNFRPCSEGYFLSGHPQSVARTFLQPFSQTFGLVYLSLNSATLSCSSEVTLLGLLEVAQNKLAHLRSHVQETLQLKEHIASHDSHYGEMKRELFPNYCHLHYLHNVRQ